MRGGGGVSGDEPRPFKSKWDIAVRGKERRGGGEERGIKKEKEERDGEGGGSAGDKKRKMTSAPPKGRGGARGCGPARAPLAGVTA